MEASFCVDALESALRLHGTPEIFNSDQGSQFTSEQFTQRLLRQNILISMDGRGRYLDNIFIERLWRTVKYDHIYMYNHETVPALYDGLSRYFERYCYRRPHQSLGYCTRAEIYFGEKQVTKSVT